MGRVAAWQPNHFSVSLCVLGVVFTFFFPSLLSFYLFFVFSRDVSIFFLLIGFRCVCVCFLLVSTRWKQTIKKQ